MVLLRSVWSRIDRFLAAILLTVAFAAMMPARGEAAEAVGWLTDAAIALLFFMHGAKLSPEDALVGARHWRLHTMVFLSTFALFPLLGISAHVLFPNFLPGPLWAGVILLTTLPSTGFCDIVPLHPITRSLSNLEAVLGQLYLTILLSRLVTLHVAGRRD